MISGVNGKKVHTNLFLPRKPLLYLPAMDTPQSTEKTADLTMNKQDEAAGLELGTFDSNPSADVLPGGRLPGSNDDVRFVTTRKELWSYYTYYVGNNALAGWSASDPSQPCNSSEPCMLGPFAGQVRDINSIVLLCNGISFAIQAGMFLLIGSFADYGSWRPWITISFTVLAWGISFGWLGVETPDKWQAAAVLYIIGLIAYQGALTFWTAAFPQLARDLPEMMESEKQLLAGEKDIQEHETLDVMSRNRISNMSFVICNAGEVVILAIMVGILKAVNSDAGVEQNTKAFSILIAFSAACWILCAIPWFVLEKHRPGKALPAGSNYFTVACKNVWYALKECLKLKQTFLYLIFYFLMGDTLNTTVTVVGTLQNSIVAYSTLQLTLLLIVGIFSSAVGSYVFWIIQKKFKINTKTMLLVNVVFILLLDGWGFLGIWLNNFGFKNVWEVWVYQAFYGFFVCPWYSYSQTMISEVVPKGKEFLFFALFSIIGKTSSFIGPFVSSAIIDRSGNDNMPFAFLLGLGIASSFLLIMVDVKKSRIECKEYLEKEA
ncbi:hypothetical protein INT44_007051 [Umbelopsis vinacea]|uniref:Autophagy-related protein n=1 Tax=Umbelopsis vinacea TaxID=44442 RepID=A0A8H7UAS1_9FUNG|nr:hypothetical protein INT44_007051 [Umbelopsis vinacea]